MNKSILCLGFTLLSFAGFSQTYEFHTIKDIEALPVISQDQTGTCWSFSTTSFLEAEIIRLTGKKVDLSEMYNVRNTYLDKAENYVMRQGKAQFGEGGLSHDVINSARKYGVVPEKNFIGKTDPDSKFDHDKMVSELEAVIKKAVAQTPKNYPNWKADYAAILDNYMGKFNEDGKIVSPQFTIDNSKSNAAEKPLTPTQFLATTKLNLDDYVTITSFTNEPYYSKFILSIPDNFANGSLYNLPLDEFIQNIDNALDKGFTLALDTDVSEKTFSKDKGIAVIPENADDSKSILTEIKPEKIITPEYRQAEFENYDTQDDHLMHIVGKVADQKGNQYYKVKNSWGTKAGRDGYFYMSVPYVKLKAISVMLSKDGLTKKTKSALRV
ncbi:C1 family peptidase [Flavobacterium wongokense]|uniref:C1 family peptidase n=1 Tax=Flavobacterium wongokense TaxID=2910674 RepID=UPI001F39F1DE|nr:C1 family peptidase [Flavobacterium sp. WG47]MCF6133205.1 C1 family peptidase [Flavobacterium sp. WG47]